ncbi:replication factor C subunit 3/5 [Nematocida minor]|uniref:replication factor C subunit 3/5 n=1 Tax=Nematocida minor TaxID=1912983 RepID=UPI00222002F0|nr:replication factor C subunit 3/5 [Nematocida minor]KAI5190216.1 replication factor C subunit 3/5 [Nematocida minor]
MIQDKYRPDSLAALRRVPAAQILADLPLESASNLILVGPEGAGKRTLFSAFIKDAFQSSPVFFSYTSTYEVSPSKSIEVEFLESKEVLEIRMEGLGSYDKKVLQKVASDISATKSIKSLLSANNLAMQENVNSSNQQTTSAPKILLITDGHLLSTGAQMALRRILEKGASNFRLVVLTTSLSHFIPAFKSRFLICRVPAPTDSDLLKIIDKVCASEEVDRISPEVTSQIVSASKGNVRIALSLLELSIHKEPIKTAPWDAAIHSISSDIIKSPGIATLIKIRAKLYEILANYMPASYVLGGIMESLLRKEKRVNVAMAITEIASKYSARMGAGTRDLFHIEAFIAAAMVLYTE